MLKLTGLPNASDALDLIAEGAFSSTFKGRSAARTALFKNINEIDPTVTYRLAAIYHAAWSAKTGRNRKWPHLPQELEWLEIYICVGLAMDRWGNTGHGEPAWTADHFVSMLNAGDHPTESLAELILLEEPKYGYAYFNQRAFNTIQGLGDYFASHPAAVVRALEHKKAQHRSHVLGCLLMQKTPVNGLLLQKVCALAVSSAKTVRQNAESLILSQSESTKNEISGFIQEKFESGRASEKTHSVGLLTKLMGVQCIDFLKKTAGREKSKKVLGEIEKYLQIQETNLGESKESEYEDGLGIPASKEYPARYDISPEAEKDFFEAMDAYNQRAIEEHKRYWDRCDPKWRHGKRDLAPPPVKTDDSQVHTQGHHNGGIA